MTSRYADAVESDAPALWWRLGDAASSDPPAGAGRTGPTLSPSRTFIHYAIGSGGGSVADSSGHAQTGTATGGVELGRTGLLRADANSAALLDGAFGTIVQDQEDVVPPAASIELWLQTTTTEGGVLAQFGSADGSQSDLTLYLRSSGDVAMRAGSTEIVRGGSGERPLNDGRRYYVVATLDLAGDLWLLVDGNEVAHASGAAVGAPFAGRWQVGSGRTDDLAVPPLSAAYAGTLDEVAIYLGGSLLLLSADPLDVITSGGDPIIVEEL